MIELISGCLTISRVFVKGSNFCLSDTEDLGRRDVNWWWRKEFIHYAINLFHSLVDTQINLKLMKIGDLGVT